MGLVTLTHTPNPMGFLREVLMRPVNERAMLVMPVGYPAAEHAILRENRWSRRTTTSAPDAHATSEVISMRTDTGRPTSPA
jgi:hypothetical protein